jgi:gluconolactonase
VRSFDPAFDALVSADARPQTIIENILNGEGPLWVGGPNGYFLMSDTVDNAILRWSPQGGASKFLQPSGYAGPPSVMFREAGSNGLILARGGLVMADTGNRGLAFLDMRTKRKTMLCREFEGRRFNSPNDLVLHKDGSIYFTDPPWGLAGVAASPWREMDYMGIFRLAPDNTVTLVDRSINMPNGIGLSPDGRTLYATAGGVGWVAWTLDAQGRASDKRVFVDGAATGLGGGDGMKIDAAGNLWTSSRDGLSVINPQGRRIGALDIGDRAVNFDFGADGHLYIACKLKAVRVPVKARKLIF